MTNQTETPINRAEALKLIFRHAHRDYRAKLADGSKMLQTIKGLVCLDNLTDEEIADRLPLARRKEAQRLESKKPKLPEFQQLPHPSIVDPFEDGPAARARGTI